MFATNLHYHKHVINNQVFIYSLYEHVCLNYLKIHGGSKLMIKALLINNNDELNLTLSCIAIQSDHNSKVFKCANKSCRVPVLSGIYDCV